MTLRLHLLPWNQPLLPQAVDLLAAGWAGDGPLDLSGVLVIVPTRQSGRRLREALAAHAHARGQAVFPPRVVPPETLATLGAPVAGIASRLTSQLAWISVLREISLEEFRAVFPVDPPERDFAWARRLASQFMNLQATLAEAGLRMADVNERAGKDFPETERWSRLTRLEQRYEKDLAARNCATPRRPSSPLRPRRRCRRVSGGIMMLGTPDPLPLATRILARHAEHVPVEIVVCGPGDEGGRRVV